uniref:uncharacterized protein LOC120948057 isoform X2 n=1 Tax=Anopheles coluzzii TaxID=1518534 RepID=UPI0020FFAF47|nr:uncharacterized protein LOC120948057 isoform X2 [Anopheles coluzzii]
MSIWTVTRIHRPPVQSDGRNHSLSRIFSCFLFPSYGKFVKQRFELPVPGTASYPSPERAVEGLDVLVRQTANSCQPSSVLFPSIALSLSRVQPNFKTGTATDRKCKQTSTQIQPVLIPAVKSFPIESVKMASNQDKKSGLMSHAISRLYKQRLEEVERELLLAQQPEPPTADDRARDAVPVQFEDVPMPMEVIDDAAPLSESEEEGTTDASSGEDTDVEDIQVEVEMPDHPYGDLSCEDGLRM